MTRIIVLLLVAALSGCVAENGSNGQTASQDDGDSFSFAGNKQGSGEFERATLDCDEDGKFSIAVNGQGNLDVSITDGNGQSIATWSFSGQGQDSDSRSLTGAAGQWTIVIEADGGSFMGGGYMGQYSGRLSC